MLPADMRRDWQIMALLAAATVAVFWQVSRHEFINFDDPAYVTYNPMVRQGLTWPGVVWAFGQLHGEATYWHPVTWLSHMLDCQLYGVKPAGHHLTSLLLHTLNTLLVFVVLRRMTGRRGPSAVVAALFALHPLQVDSVAWIAERKNVLSACFFLLTLWAYARYAEGRRLKAEGRRPRAEGSPKAEARRPGAEGVPRSAVRSSGFEVQSSTFDVRAASCRLWYWAAVGLFALGLMSKPTIVPLPFLLLVLDYWPLRRLELKPSDFRLKAALPLLVEKLPFLALSAAASVVTIRSHEALGALVSASELPVSARLANAVVACALYVRKLVWPLDLSVFYLHPGDWPDWSVALSALLLLGLTAAGVWQMRRRPHHHHKHADHRHIREAVRQRLHVRLHQPDHRHQHSQKPEPAHDQMRAAPRLPDRHRAHAQHEQRAAGDGLLRPAAGVQVEHAQIQRPDQLAQIEGAGHHGVLQPERHRKLFGAYQSAQGCVGPDRHQARSSRQAQERKFVQDETPPG